MLGGSGRGGSRRGGGPGRYGADTDASLELLPSAAPPSAPGAVLRREQPDPRAWSGLDHRLVLCLHSLELTPQVGPGGRRAGAGACMRSPAACVP